MVKTFFSIITLLYLIAKVEIIMKLSHEIIKLKHDNLYQKEKRNKMFQVKVISKDFSKTIVSF